MKTLNSTIGKVRLWKAATLPLRSNASGISMIVLALAILCSDSVYAQKKILFYGPTYNPNGAAEQLVETSTEFWHVNTGTTRSEVWTPGDPVASKDWSKKTTADFQAFDAIVFSDIHAGGTQITEPSVWTGAIANVSVWSTAVTGNILLFGGDPEAHEGFLCQCGGNFPVVGAQHVIEHGIRFAAAAGHGLYLPLSAIDPNLPSPVNPGRKCVDHLLSGLGTFSTVRLGAEKVRKLYQTSLFFDLTETEMSDWLDSAHLGFKAWPAGYQPLALVTDALANQLTPSNLLPPGEQGTVYTLAKSSSLRLLDVNPTYSSYVVGSTSDSFTAYFKDGNGNGISGKTVSFFLTSDSKNYDMGTHAGSGLTAADGSVAFSQVYTGNQVGRDTVTVQVTDNTTIYTRTRFVDWVLADNIVSITATDANATEPATQGGVGDPGTFTITRGGTPSSQRPSLTVRLYFRGTATRFIQGPDGDYSTTPITSQDNNKPDHPVFADVTIPGNASSTTLTVTPTFDDIREVTETVVAQIGISESTPITYGVGAPSEATVNIVNSPATDSITLTAVDNQIAEGDSDNPALIQLQRTGSSGDVDVALTFSGVASFGDDYFIEVIDPINGTLSIPTDNKVTIPDTITTVLINVIPVPDSRFEGNEDLTIAIGDSPNGDYMPGNPSSVPLTIVDNDSVQAPLGWVITDLGNFGGPSGGSANALAINSIPNGPGQYRGAVGGFQINSQIPLYKGILWDNGTPYLRNYPSSWPLAQGDSPWSQVFGLNNNSTAVGYCNYYRSGNGYHQWASYWNAGVSTPILLPVWFAEGLDNVAYAINQRNYTDHTGGIIVGTEKFDSTGKVHAMMWVPAVNDTYPTVSDLLNLGSTPSQNSYAYAINDQGEVVGKSQVGSSTVYRAFRSRSDVNNIPIQLDQFQDDMGSGTFGESSASEANDINNLGELVGASLFAGNVYHAAYKSSGTTKNFGWHDLGVLGQGANAGTQSIARGISNTGVIVGKSQIKVNNVMVWHGFALRNDGNPGSQALLDLNDYSYIWTGTTWYTAAQAGWVVQTAERVNDGNWIVGYGTKNGTTHAFVMSPR